MARAQRALPALKIFLVVRMPHEFSRTRVARVPLRKPRLQLLDAGRSSVERGHGLLLVMRKPPGIQAAQNRRKKLLASAADFCRIGIADHRSYRASVSRRPASRRVFFLGGHWTSLDSGWTTDAAWCREPGIGRPQKKCEGRIAMQQACPRMRAGANGPNPARRPAAAQRGDDQNQCGQDAVLPSWD